MFITMIWSLYIYRIIFYAIQIQWKSYISVKSFAFNLVTNVQTRRAGWGICKLCEQRPHRGRAFKSRCGGAEGKTAGGCCGEVERCRKGGSEMLSDSLSSYFLNSYPVTFPSVFPLQSINMFLPLRTPPSSISAPERGLSIGLRTLRDSHEPASFSTL